MKNNELSHFFDHTLLRADTTKVDVLRICEEAKEYHFFGVCVNSSNIPLTADALKGSDVVPVSVVGFPLGASNTESKVHEASWAIEKGAREIDTVINLGAYFSGDLSYVKKDISGIVKICNGVPLKVILETALLDNDQIIELTKLAAGEGASYIKTSTGFSSRGASLGDIMLIKKGLEALGLYGKVGIKASGGIKTLDFTLKLIKEGANRIGASSSVDIIKEN